MINIKSNEDFVRMILKDQLSICMFTGQGCSDCTLTKEIVNELEEDYPVLSFYEVSRNELSSLVSDLHIDFVPSFISYKDGREISRFVSGFRKTKDEIIGYIEMNLKKEEKND